VNGTRSTIIKARATCILITHGILDSASICGLRVKIENKYGDNINANHEEPQRYPKATHRPKNICAKRISPISRSILFVTIFILGLIMRLNNRLNIPTSALNPKINADTSKIIKRVGLLFHERTTSGSKKAIR
jgi:hypothetical protein